MMQLFSDIFEKFLDVISVLILIAGAIVGGIIGNSFDHLMMGVIIGLLAVFISEVFIFGSLAQIIAIKTLLEEQSKMLKKIADNAAYSSSKQEKQSNISQKIPPSNLHTNGE
ncbi:MAG: hypothetical protein NC041_08720 [Bacteroides sp.]|nr:hypothetical protein [Prevotella sp.]MCM1408673.1 hypothetical protein [Treponema brennaborense]MCM1470534.1 hypothetical protein [Bacteroides sp.]